MRSLVSFRCLLIALAIAALVTSALHIDRLQRRIDSLRSDNKNLSDQNNKLTMMAQDYEDKVKVLNDKATDYRKLMQQWNTEINRLKDEVMRLKGQHFNIPPWL